MFRSTRHQFFKLKPRQTTSLWPYFGRAKLAGGISCNGLCVALLWPVMIYGCEARTPKNEEDRRIQV